MCSIKLTDWTVSSVAAALPSEVSLHVPPGCLLEFYKHNSLLTPFIWTVRATCQSDGLDPFLLRWTVRHVDKSLQKGKGACPF